MKKIIYFTVILISILSCRAVRFHDPNQISLKEANRILKDAIEKSGIIDSSKSIVIFRKEIYLGQANIILYDSTKIKKLDLSNFQYFSSIKKVNLIKEVEIKSDNEIIGFWIISFTKTIDERVLIYISSDFYIPPAKQPIEIEGFSFRFEYKVVKGQAKLIRWRGF